MVKGAPITLKQQSAPEERGEGPPGKAGLVSATWLATLVVGCCLGERYSLSPRTPGNRPERLYYTLYIIHAPPLSAASTQSKSEDQQRKRQDAADNKSDNKAQSTAGGHRRSSLSSIAKQNKKMHYAISEEVVQKLHSELDTSCSNSIYV